MPRSEASLTLAEQVVLLMLDDPRRRTATALKAADLPRLRDTTDTLEAKGFIEYSALHRAKATSTAPLLVLRRRLYSTVRDVSAPSGSNGDLLLLVAFAGGLDAASASDHLNARHRIAALDAHGRPGSRVLRNVLEYTGSESAAERRGSIAIACRRRRGSA